MKIKNKKAFSLAEVLIALAIISIISTMGFSIAKHAIANAYQGYYYTAYKALNTAFKEAYDKFPSNLDNQKKHIKMMLSLDEDLNSNDFVNAPNGVGIKLDNSSSLDSFRIRVPSAKTKQISSNYRYVKFAFEPDNPYAIYLQPKAPNTNEEKAKGYIDLASRKDLLVFRCDNEDTQSKVEYKINEDPDSEDYGKITEITQSTPKTTPIFSSYKDLDVNGCKDGDYPKVKIINPKKAYN